MQKLLELTIWPAAAASAHFTGFAAFAAVHEYGDWQKHSHRFTTTALRTRKRPAFLDRLMDTATTGAALLRKITFNQLESPLEYSYCVAS